MADTLFKIQDGQQNLSDAETVMILIVSGILNESNCDLLTEPKRILNLLYPLENHGIFQSIKVEATDMRPMYDMSLHLKWRTSDMAEGEWRCVKFMLQKRDDDQGKEDSTSAKHFSEFEDQFLKFLENGIDPYEGFSKLTDLYSTRINDDGKVVVKDLLDDEEYTLD